MFRRSLTLLSACALALLFSFAPQTVRAQAAQSGDVIIVLPFENTTNQREYHWIGTSSCRCTACVPSRRTSAS